MRSLAPLRRFLFAAVWLGVTSRGWSEPKEAVDVPYVLPEFEVSEVPEGLPWKYARQGDMEILTLCSAETSERVFSSFWLGRFFLPGAFRPDRTEPWTILVFDEAQVKGSTVIREVALERSSYRLSPTSRWRRYNGGIGVGDGDKQFFALRFAQEVPVPRINHAIAQLSFLECRPAPPAWLTEGLFGRTGLWQEMGYYHERDEIRYAALQWMNEAETRRIRKEPEALPELIPLGEFFNQLPPEPEKEPQRWARWASQARLFVHWAMVGDKAPPVDAATFWRFAHEGRAGRVSEPFFRRIWGRDFATAERQMLAYLHRALSNGADRPMPGLHRAGLPHQLVFRAATEAEVARLKGNFERMQAKDYRQRAPALAARYEAAARRSFDRGMRFGSADNQIVGALGLLEYETGHPDKARGYLERAHTTGDLGTRGLLALADLRWREMTTGLTAEGKLPAEALERVLDPLFAARERKPAVIETYQMLADVWERSGFPPTRNHLAVLVEGVEFFPTDETLRARTVRLHEVHGYRDILAGLAEIR